MKKKIFYYFIDGSGGGSDHSLFNLIKGLNKNRFEPYVWIKKKSFFNKKLEILGAVLLIGGQKKIFDNRNLITNEIIKKKSKHLRNTKFFYYFYTTPKLIVGSMPEAMRIYRMLKKYDINLVHTNHCLNNDRSALIAGFFAGAKVISHYRGIVKPEKIDVFLSRFVNKIICISEFVKRDYVSQGIDPGKCVVIHNGVDIDQFAPREDSTDDKLVIANIGRLEEWKGQRIFLETAAEIIKTNKNLKFLIVGNGSIEKDLKELAKKLCIDDYVEFKGFVEDIPNLLEKVDILVHSSIEPEPFGRVIIEGMAAGLPVIATNIGGPKEIIDDKKNGLLVRAGSCEDLLSKILKLINEADYRRDLGTAAREKSVLTFDIKRTTEEIERIYE